ncbi:MAG: putative phosphonate metabolism protein Phn01 [Roseibaca calidilacus]|uniref:Phosphonate metabolism protein n=1 Tax=Roseibaca calidilacus TaxID=1666912 RepID=A0A0P7W637_9RHOB|nr:DUF1045 domain-containing protein [Roseibaca calidilacus]KPP92279.1 MAG: putative phosphonate metabolism protein Phn01 [Roseibaca calidilacus]CUX79573.1 putative phosphonate metabolism protein [Roseibaca calidilacus]
MPDHFSRYAVFYAPPEGSDFAAAGARWLGWDPAAGQDMPHPDLGLDLATVTRTPRKYGLHGTLRAPMRLATAPATFLDAVETFAQKQPPVLLGKLRLRVLGGFLAILPDPQGPTLETLAADLVRATNPFRAALSQADLDRRRAAGLTPHQDALLTEWGYPFVMDEFRFHITLSGKLDDATMRDLFRAADAWFGPILAEPHEISELAVFGEDESGRFHLLRRFALTG